MKCDECGTLLDLYIDGCLPGEMNAKVERHLLRCPACSGELRSMEQTIALLRDAVQRQEPSPSFRERAAARLQAQLAGHLRSVPELDLGRQWSLPFAGGDF